MYIIILCVPSGFSATPLSMFHTWVLWLYSW